MSNTLKQPLQNQQEIELMSESAKKIRIVNHVIFVVGIFLSIAQTAGFKSQELNSHWRNTKTTVDGINDEWENATTYIEDEMC